MKVKEIMTANAKACTPTDNLVEAAGFMWENDCGILPVVAEGGKVVGLVTDRDICMAAAALSMSGSNRWENEDGHTELAQHRKGRSQA